MIRLSRLRPASCGRLLRRFLSSDAPSTSANSTLETSTSDSANSSAETSKKSEFKPLVIPGLTVTETKQTELYQAKFSQLHEQKVEEDDWMRVWPCENFFSPSMFPAPIRQGHSKNLVENGGLPPGKYANAELLKIPNFLHLTPSHIEKHCAALKKFTTKWPSGLKSDEDVDKHYPVEVVTRAFVNSAPSIRDRRARRVSIRVPVKSLGLDEHGRLKLLRLVKAYGFERGMGQYYSDEDVIVLTSERCPISRQNYDYLAYVLTVLTLESRKHEAWEDDETGSYLDFKWEKSRQRERILKLLSPQTATPSASEIDELPAVKAYRSAVEQMFKTPTEEVLGPWKKPRRQPRRRHYHWPEIKDVPLEPVVGADDPSHLEAYAKAVKQLYASKHP
uniref:MRP-S28 domain-containing protein n=1 Tax=Mesocestoides corti TaxID=53468 RepID=A0A5K3FRE3_MESCO